jgi:hypothetical protein
VKGIVGRHAAEGGLALSDGKIGGGILCRQGQGY